MSDYDTKTMSAVSAMSETESHADSDASSVDSSTSASHKVVEETKPKRGGGRKKGLKRTLETYENALSLAQDVIAGDANEEMCKSLIEHIHALGKSLVKKPKDDSKPKRPPSAWNLFMTAVSKEISAETGMYWDNVREVYERMNSDGTSKKGLRMKAISEVFGEKGDHRNMFEQFAKEHADFIGEEKAKYDEQMKELGYDVKHREKGGQHKKIMKETLDEIYSEKDSAERELAQRLIDEANRRFNEETSRKRAETKIRKAEEEAHVKAGVSEAKDTGDIVEVKSKSSTKAKPASASASASASAKPASAKKASAGAGTDAEITEEKPKPKSKVVKKQNKIMLIPLDKAGTVVGESKEIGAKIWKVENLPGWKKDEAYDISSIKHSYIMKMVDGKVKATLC